MRGLKPELNTALKNHLLGRCLSPALYIEENCGILVIWSDADDLLSLMTHLKNDPECNFNVLVDLTAVDYLNKKSPAQRFEVVYLLWSTFTMHRVRVKVVIPDGVKVPTVTGIWKGANWPEREVFDLFGIEFSGHPVMERIIMPENFRGYPLRKDFPLEGLGEDYLVESILIDSSSAETGNQQGAEN